MNHDRKTANNGKIQSVDEARDNQLTKELAQVQIIVSRPSRTNNTERTNTEKSRLSIIGAELNVSLITISISSTPEILQQTA